MSGTLAIIAAAGAMQMPVLKGGSTSFLTPTSGAGALLAVNRNGTMSIFYFGNTVTTNFPGQWGGSAPFATQGDAYEVRLTLQSGGLIFGDPEFELAETWYALSSNRSFKTLALSSNGQFDNQCELQIRRAGTTQILARGTFFSSVNNFN